MIWAVSAAVTVAWLIEAFAIGRGVHIDVPGRWPSSVIYLEFF